MTTAEVIAYIAATIYMGGGPNKKACLLLATRLVDKLIDAGVLITTDATPSLAKTDA